MKVDETIAAIRRRDRRALARAITLAESTRLVDRETAEDLITRLLPHTGNAMRIGISGAPGSGKSTLIEVLGEHMIRASQRVAVLAVDPSSRRSGGSVLGDKTRMERLARDPGAFIRPSPAGTTLGGVARRTHETLLLVEAAGFDVVVVETVGVGQSETAVADMVDLFVLLVSPGTGDDLQGIKRGVMELADLVLVTKADGDLAQAAARTAAEYSAALRLLRPKYPGIVPLVMKVSAVEDCGITDSWKAMRDFRDSLCASDHLRLLREKQARHWFWSELQDSLAEAIAADPAAASEAARVEAEVLAGRTLPHAAARSMIHAFRRPLDGPDRRP